MTLMGAECANAQPDGEKLCVMVLREWQTCNFLMPQPLFQDHKPQEQAQFYLARTGMTEQDNTYKEAEGFNLFWKSLP